MRQPCDVREMISIERDVLRALCNHVGPPHPKRWLEQLSSYRWRNSEHATVFLALRRLAGRGHTSWREDLPAETTRMGFPDIEWTRYLAAGDLDPHAVEELTARLFALDAPPRKT